MRALSVCLVLSVLTLNAVAQITDPSGVILIDQQHAQIGGIGPGDASGFPVTITQSGSYKLASNLAVFSPNTNAILIQADNVTLDLNGFAITGPKGTINTGILLAGNSATIKNGVVQGFGNGIVVLTGAPVTVQLTNVQVVGNNVYGLQAGGNGGHVITACKFEGNAIGVALESGTLSDSTIIRNTQTGVSAVSSVVSHNVIVSNIEGLVSKGSAILGNTIANNSDVGLSYFGPNKTLFGSNSIVGNGADLSGSAGLSQNNNACTSGPC